jgi:methionyl-tRNA formyltransferase
VVLEDVAVVDEAAADLPADPAADLAVAPGTILSADDAGLVVACGEGTRLVIRRLVPEGKRSMSAAEFLRGHALFNAARFG